MTAKHEHKFVLAKYYPPTTLVDTRYPASSEWICECGASKSVEH